LTTSSSTPTSGGWTTPTSKSGQHLRHLIWVLDWECVVSFSVAFCNQAMGSCSEISLGGFLQETEFEVLVWERRGSQDWGVWPGVQDVVWLAQWQHRSCPHVCLLHDDFFSSPQVTESCCIHVSFSPLYMVQAMVCCTSNGDRNLFPLLWTLISSFMSDLQCNLELCGPLSVQLDWTPYIGLIQVVC